MSERIVINSNIDMKSEKKMKELNDEYFEAKLENSEFESESKSSFETSNLSDDDLSDDESDKSVKSQEISRKIISKLAFLMSEKKCKDINSSCYILNLLF